MVLRRGVLSRAGGGLVCLFCFPACLQVPAMSAILIYSICYRTFLKSLLFKNFVSLGAGRYINFEYPRTESLYISHVGLRWFYIFLIKSSFV